MAQVPTAGLVAEYLFTDGSYEDTNPNGQGPNDAVGATMVSNTVDRFGNPNGAKYLLGINYLETEGTYIQLGSGAVLKPRSATISIWVNMDKVSYSGWGYEYNPIILARNTRSPEPPFEGYALYAPMEGKTYATTVQPEPLEQTILQKGNVPLDTWRHYVMSYDDSSLKLYEDGVLIQTVPKGYSSQEIFSMDEVVVGSSMNELNNRAFNGAVDDIRIYNRMLSDAEVQDLYGESNPTVVYAQLREVLDAGFYPLAPYTNTVYFHYEEAYKAGTLDYKVYDQNRADITTSVVLDNVDLNGPSNKRQGTNRYKLTLPSLNAGEFYLLEVTNEKGEKEYLRFVQI